VPPRPDPQPEDAPQPDAEPERERTDFPCEQCGAPTVWDPDADALACEYCGHTRAVPRADARVPSSS
jgi:DNA-directed RNA polymerase subunit RPC12/RpoP